MVGKRQEEGLALADNSLEVKIIQSFFFQQTFTTGLLCDLSLCSDSGWNPILI